MDHPGRTTDLLGPDGPSGQLFRLLFERATVGIAIADVRTGILIACNPKLAEMVGRSPGELVGQPHSILHPALGLEGGFARSFLKHREQGFGDDIDDQLITRSGQIRHVRIVGNVLDLDTRQVILGVFVDQTARRRAEEALRESEQRLASAQRLEALGVLAGGMAHEINNVLSVVLGLGSILEEDLPRNDPNRGPLADILQAAQRGRVLVQNLLGFARKGCYRKVLWNLNQTVRLVLTELEADRPQGVIIKTRLAEDLPEIECDPGQMGQLLANLMSNALDAVDGKGEITVATEVLQPDLDNREALVELPPGPAVRLSVRDNGCGMEEIVRQHVFDPFFTTKPPGQGVGLGLPMVYGVAKAHLGEVIVESAPGQGTSVAVYLPAQKPETPTARPEAKPARAGTVRGRLLLVDDEEMVREVGQRMLELSNHEVIVAEGGAAALGVVRNQIGKIDLVLLDLSMPEMSGEVCFGKLLEIQPDLKVILCTGYGSSKQTKDMMAKGAIGVLSKPFSLRELSRAVERALAGEPLEDPDPAQEA